MIKKISIIFFLTFSMNADLFSQDDLSPGIDNVLESEYIEIGVCIGPFCNDGESSADKMMRIRERLIKQNEKANRLKIEDMIDE